jgi:hypothetical protein
VYVSRLNCANGLALRIPFPCRRSIYGETQNKVPTDARIEVAAFAVILVYISLVKGRMAAIIKDLASNPPANAEAA